MQNKYTELIMKIFEIDKETGDFKDARIVFVIFGFAILSAGFAEAIVEMML